MMTEWGGGRGVWWWWWWWGRVYRDKDKLILLGNGMSQPSRAVMWFLEVNRIPFEFRLVRIMKGQHLTDQYATMYVSLGLWLSPSLDSAPSRRVHAFA
jgi:hypothetical protein